MLFSQKKRSVLKTKKNFAKLKALKILPRSAVIDHPTTFYNRRYFDKRLKEIIWDTKRANKRFSLLMVNIDNFKATNDKYGHLAGDEILANLAKVLKTSVRRIDLCFRYGGDEIAIILPGARKEMAEHIIARLQNRVETHKFSIEKGAKLYLKLSIGLAVFPADGLTPKILVKKADDSLYKAKRQKRRRAEPFILRTKLIAPTLKASIVFRPRLLSVLRENLDKKLILVNADAGYGKTTLLTQAINELKTPYIWYQIDKSDQEIDVFVRYLVEGMRRYVPEFGKRTFSVINHGQRQGIEIEVLIGTFINEVIEIPEQKIVLVFDDLQEIYTSKEVMSGFDYLLNHMPKNISIIILARSKPPFSLERLQFKNEIINLDQKDLRFNKDEIRALCKQLGDHTPNAEELKELEADSEGWITCLQFLARLVKQETIFAESKKSLISRLNDYFEKEVFASLEQDTKNFLSATSVLDFLSPEVCNFVLLRDDSAELLMDLEKRHLFISAYPAAEPTYRYHHLFREFLLKKLKETGLSQKIQNRAGKYWQKKSVLPTALQHYSEAKNYQSIARLLKKFGGKYIIRGKVEFIKHHIEGLPKNILNSSISLNRLKGRICEWDCDWNGARVHYSKAIRLARCQKNYFEFAETMNRELTMKLYLGGHRGIIKQINNLLRSRRLKSYGLRVSFLNILGWVLAHEGKYSRSITVYEEMLKLTRKLNNESDLNSALNNLAITHLEAGNFIHAQNCISPLVIKLRSNPSPPLIFALNTLGGALIKQGEVIKANKIYEEAQRYAELFNDRRRLTVCNKNFGDAKILIGELEQAEQLLQRAEDSAIQIGYKFVLADIWNSMATLAVEQGDFYEAKQHVNKALEVSLPPAFRTSCLITKAKIELFLKNLSGAKRALGQVQSDLKEPKDTLMTLFFQRARFYLLKKNETQARKYFNKSIDLAEKNTYDFLLLYELKHCPEIIKFVKKVGLKSDYLDHLLLKLPYSDVTEVLVEPDMIKYDFVVRLFGKVQIFMNSKEIQTRTWRTKRFQELFSFFMAHRSLITSREKIFYTFWPDHRPFTVKQLFHNALYRIRKIIGKNMIIFKEEGYQPSSKYQYWIDVEEFEKRAQQGKQLTSDGNLAGGLIKYEEALSLYRGDFMNDFYSEWCQQKRRYFEEIYLEVLKKLAQGHHKLGNFAKALKFANSVISKNPYDEDVYCLAMRCYAELNDLGGLQNCYSNLEKTLAEGLKTAPNTETAKLFENLKKQRKI